MADDCFLAHLRDLTNAALRTGAPRFTAFLNTGEQALLCRVQAPGVTQTLWGGWQDAERKMLCLHPDTFEISGDSFPFSCIRIQFRPQDTLSHRDILGSVLAHGIRRELVGDILMEDGLAQLFVCKAATPLLTHELCRVGHVGVRVSCCAFSGSYQRTVLPIQGTVASLRLDAVVRLAINRSREQASVLVSAKAVFVGGLPVGSPSALVREGDIISIRGFGKFRLAAVSGLSKTGRLHITLEKFC